jgi:flagellar biosynthesis/type III secretory pathway protein FliH
MTMTTSSRRVLKSGDVDDAQIVALAAAALETPEQVPVPTEPLLFTASETEALCETARQAGAADAAAEIESLLQRMTERLEQLTAAEQEQETRGHAADAETIADTALSVCRWVLGHELRHPKQILDLVDAALTSEEVTGESQLRLHPDSVEDVAAIAPANLTVVADPNLPRGEFLIRTDGPDIALRFELALERARAALLSEEQS